MKKENMVSVCYVIASVCFYASAIVFFINSTTNKGLGFVHLLLGSTFLFLAVVNYRDKKNDD